MAVANPSSQSCWSRKVLAPARNSLGGSALSSPPIAPDSSSARVPAPWPLPETSTTATSRRSPTREVTTKSPANGVPPAERSSAAAYHSSGSAGMPPWRRIRSRRSTNICSPWMPATPRRERRKDDSRTTKPEPEDDDHRQHDADVMSWSGTTTASTSSTNTTNHGSWRGPSIRLEHHGGTSRVTSGASWREAARSATADGERRDDQRAPRIRDPRGHDPVAALARCAAAHGAAHAPSSSRRARLLGRRLYGAGAERGLTSRTPEDVASDQLAGPDRRAADVARHRRAPVDVDLAAVVVLARRPPHRLGQVLGPDRVDATGAHALGHELDQVGPHRAPLADAQRVAGAQRVDAVPEEHLGAVDVADAGQHLLVHQQVADRRAGCARSAATPGRGRRRSQRVGPEPAQDLGAPAPGRPGRTGSRRAGRRTPSRGSSVAS